jgi:hypothetical protein
VKLSEGAPHGSEELVVWCVGCKGHCRADTQPKAVEIDRTGHMAL